jgi:hypothetical protein
MHRGNFKLYIKLKTSSTALTVDCRHSTLLNFVPHEAVKPRHIGMHACHKVMDLMSLAPFVGQSSTIKNDTVTKTGYIGLICSTRGCSIKVAHINKAISRFVVTVLTGNKHCCVFEKGGRYLKKMIHNVAELRYK